ncbi:hypothetical protein D3C87_1683790 [compost metagenome]|jgi:hypothetical protein|uniref:DUF4926 domain-containing protein n=1 Tax=Cupriavidus campinensis TaxID=151783 RepID=A0ABY3EU38_9BURK|nr:DUF4926 domain-containing protein [Cupriavidus campinensis]
MVNANLLDVVLLTEDIPEEGLRAGMKGTVVEVHQNPYLAYEVEFCDEMGRTSALVALLPNQIRVVWRQS